MKENSYFAVVALNGLHPPKILPADIGKAATCPTEERRTEKEERKVAIMTAFTERGISRDNPNDKLKSGVLHLCLLQA
jgi:hypothetical protein